MSSSFFILFMTVANKNHLECLYYKELQMRGFSDLICFDGGGGLYFNKNGNVEHLVGRDSPSGLAIKVK